MRTFSSKNSRLMVSYILVVAISIILALIVWSYYNHKVKLLEEKEIYKVNIEQVTNSLITYGAYCKCEVDFGYCYENSDHAFCVVTPNTPHHLINNFSGQERIDIGQYRYSQTIV